MERSGNFESPHKSNVFVIIVDFITLLINIVVLTIISIAKIFKETELKDVKGEVILITGTGHGIGRELAIQYTALGCKVICIDVNDETNKATVKAANAQRNGRAYAYNCDITKRNAIQQLARKIEKDVGNVSVIVNNAGVMPSHTILKYTEEQIHNIFNVNVFSHIWMLQEFMPNMLKVNKGHIIAISSVAGFCGLPNIVPYCASKFAVRGLMEALQDELRLLSNESNIKTTIIFPYMVDTGLCKNPKMRFPNMLGLITAKTAATAIIKAHRQNVQEISIPKSLYYLNNVLRCMPVRCGALIKDFVDSGVYPELE